MARLPTTCQSRARLDHCAKQDAAVTERLRDAGAVLVDKLATFEFALGQHERREGELFGRQAIGIYVAPSA